jgi:hypothetical protein
VIKSGQSNKDQHEASEEKTKVGLLKIFCIRCDFLNHSIKYEI